MLKLQRIDPVIKTVGLTQADLLGAAWLCEQAGQWRRHIGDHAWADALFADASRMRSVAVDQ